MDRKQIERLPYGTSEQNDAADEWFSRFCRFAHRHEGLVYGRHPSVWHRLLSKDVWALANQRRLFSNDALAS